MGFYTDKGYINFDHIMENKAPFIFIVGGRGSGKTYGALKYALENNRVFFFMRRTQTQIDLIKNDAFSPFKAVDPSIMVNPINKAQTISSGVIPPLASRITSNKFIFQPYLLLRITSQPRYFCRTSGTFTEPSAI